MKEKLARWVSRSAPKWLILAVYFILDKFNFSARRNREAQRVHNLEILNATDSVLKDGYIDNQYEWKEVKFGKTTMSYSGCEVMATYNILKSMGKGSGPEYMCGLISDFERKGAALKGLIGSSPLAIRKYLKKNNIKTKLVWNNESVGDDTNRIIVTFYNNRETVEDMIHTVAIIKEDEGYRIYNAGPDKAFDSIQEALAQVSKNPKTICILKVME